MTFVELTRDDGISITLNSQHIISFKKCPHGGTEMFLINNSMLVKDTYEDVQSLLDTIMMATVE